MPNVLERTGPKWILKHCKEMGLDSSVLSACLAVHPKTIQRWDEGSAYPNEATLRSLEKLEAIYQTVVKLLDKQSVKVWFSATNQSLGGERPVDLLVRGEIEQVRNVLGMLEWGIYS